MSTVLRRGTDAQDIVANLNTLLHTLAIPVVLELPNDLTPSLLVAILESVLQDRLPISQATRGAKDIQSRVETMRIFLGVLENELGQDGASKVDPRKLATGGWDETVIVGECLVSVGRIFGLSHQSSPSSLKETATAESPRSVPIATAADDDPSFDIFWAPTAKQQSGHSRHSDSGNEATREPVRRRFSDHSTSTGLDDSSSFRSGSSARLAESSFASSVYTPQSSSSSLLKSSHISPNTEDSPKPHWATTSSSSVSTTPRCIHEVEDLEVELSLSLNSNASLADTSECDCSTRPLERKVTTAKTPTVRYSGWIEAVDDEEEVRSFEASRNVVGTSRSPPMRYSRTIPHYAGLSHPSTPKTHTLFNSTSSPGRVLTRHNSPTQHTLALMNERAKLLEELASLKASKLR
ncbi:hypothetical protein BC835DRAFT_1305066 [Cytidiella melzeri]|nr:hypothetical protein BC835DRAFT_1305066 [Cytidiella melzeri]